MNTKQTSYSEKLRDPRWQKKRLCVMQRDGFACRDCGDEKSTLQVHHCRYENGEPWKVDDQFLLTLCGSCHERRGPVEKEMKRAFELAMAWMPVEAINLQLEDRGINSFLDWAKSVVLNAINRDSLEFRETLDAWICRRNAAVERAKSNE